MPFITPDSLNFADLAQAFKLLPHKKAETSTWNAKLFIGTFRDQHTFSKDDKGSIPILNSGHVFQVTFNLT